MSVVLKDLSSCHIIKNSSHYDNRFIAHNDHHHHHHVDECHEFKSDNRNSNDSDNNNAAIDRIESDNNSSNNNNHHHHQQQQQQQQSSMRLQENMYTSVRFDIATSTQRVEYHLHLKAKSNRFVTTAISRPRHSFVLGINEDSYIVIDTYIDR